MRLIHEHIIRIQFTYRKAAINFNQNPGAAALQ